MSLKIQRDCNIALRLAEQRKDFLNHMSHEMRTPLNVRDRPPARTLKPFSHTYAYCGCCLLL